MTEELYRLTWPNREQWVVTEQQLKELNIGAASCIIQKIINEQVDCPPEFNKIFKENMENLLA